MSSKISVLFIGDIVGEPGRLILEKKLPVLIEEYKADLVIVNAENICNGKGVTEKEAEEIFSWGAHVITTGNHVWDNWKSKPLLASNSLVLRPLNYPTGNPGKGYAIINILDNITVCVLQIQGRTFMQPIDCPFKAVEHALKAIHEKTKIIIVDFHAETTAEKVSMGWFLDGKVSAVLGTHTHIPTADACILPNGTAYITDVGMTGPYDSVVGMKKEVALKRHTLQTPHKYEGAEGDEKISGVNVIIDMETGQAESIKPFTLPKFISSIFDQL